MASVSSNQGFRAVPAILLICLLALLPLAGCGGKSKETFVAPPPTIDPEMIPPWRKAALKVEEDRGEPIGRKAQVEVPAELKHYSDHRRFLAVQVAEYLTQKYEIPSDFAELVALIRRNQLVEMEPLGESYILYGVGANASDEPFSHYDQGSDEDIPLYSSFEEFQKEIEKIAVANGELQKKIADLDKDFKKTNKHDRNQRAALSAQIAESRKALTAASKTKEKLEYFYKNPERRKMLMTKYRLISDLAADFNGQTYDLNDANARKELKVRLLSFIRPEARDILVKIAAPYKEKFDRPLPITSLVRTERYQQRLSKTNPNATRISTPPHATGLAFDIYDHFMTAAEQQFLMGEIARLEADGRLEALRENRDHIHVFAFADGRPPDEAAIAKSMGQMKNAKQVKAGVPSRDRKGAKSRSSQQARSKGKTKKASSVATNRKRRGKAG
jgi:Skp family chaperone for outer membrane proteins